MTRQGGAARSVRDRVVHRRHRLPPAQTAQCQLTWDRVSDWEIEERGGHRAHAAGGRGRHATPHPGLVGRRTSVRCCAALRAAAAPADPDQVRGAGRPKDRRRRPRTPGTETPGVVELLGSAAKAAARRREDVAAKGAGFAQACSLEGRRDRRAARRVGQAVTIVLPRGRRHQLERSRSDS